MAFFLSRLNPALWIRARFRGWWQARLPRTDYLTLHQRNVYILPTRPGFMLATTLLVLLVASINYQLNLGYLLTFLLAGSTVVGMHICHGTLRGLRLQLAPVQPGFAGAAIPLDIQLHNPGAGTRHGIGLRLLDDGDWSWTDVPPLASQTVHLACNLPARGLQPVPPLTAETRFPMGTFRVWSVWRPAAQVMVYPAPEIHPPPLPPGEPRDTGSQQPTPVLGQDFDGVRLYRRGDPLKTIVWKKAAKSDTLVSRDTQQNQRTELWLDYLHTGLADHEARLSRLCAWVLRAEGLGQHYGLRLPGKEIPPGHGKAHKRQCLEALALC